MMFEPVEEEHYGRRVEVNPLTEKLRPTECLCLNCGGFRMASDDPCRCHYTEELFEIAKKYGLAFLVTRCPEFTVEEDG